MEFHKGKDKPKNPKNATFESYKAKVNNLAENKANNLFQHKNFGDEWAAIYNVSSILKIVFSIASFLTVLIAVFLALKPLLGSVASGGLSFAICSMLELLKVWTWEKLAKAVLNYKVYPLALVGGCLLFNLSSVGGSLLGAYQLPRQASILNTNKAKSIDIDSINKSYLLQIAKIDQTIREQSKEATKTTSDYIKGKINKTLLALADQKSILIEQQNRSIESAEIKNKSTLAEFKTENTKDEIERAEKMENTQYTLVGVAVSFEFFLILCGLFISYYLYRVHIDNTESDHTGTQSDPTPTNNSFVSERKVTAHEAPTAKKIGFFKTKDEKRPDIIGDTQTAQNEQILDKLEYTRICKNKECSKPYLHGHNAQKYCSAKCRKKANR